MADYSLVVGSKFSPFTFEELLKPALMATEMHYDLEDKYNTLSDTTSGIEGLINPVLDAELYEKTKQYANDLNAQVELLSKEGLSPNLRRNLGTLRNRFASELAPIKTAYDNREKASKLVRELSIKDPSMIIERDPRTLSLKEFIDNPELDQGRYISGKDLSSRVAQAVQNAKKTIFANRPSTWNSIFGGQYYEKKNITGWTEQEINDAIAGKGPKELRDIVDNVLASSGIAEWATPEQLEAARRYSNEGLWSGLGTTDYERVQNRDYGVTPNNGGKNPKQEKDPYANIQNIISDNTGKKLKNYYNIIDSEYQKLTSDGINKVIQQVLYPTPDAPFVYYVPASVGGNPVQKTNKSYPHPDRVMVNELLEDNPLLKEKVYNIVEEFKNPKESETENPTKTGISAVDKLKVLLSDYEFTPESNLMTTSVFRYPITSEASTYLKNRISPDSDTQQYILYDYGVDENSKVIVKSTGEKLKSIKDATITDIDVSTGKLLGKITIPTEGGVKQSYVDLSDINPIIYKTLKNNYTELEELYREYKNSKSEDVRQISLDRINDYKKAMKDEIENMLYGIGLQK